MVIKTPKNFFLTSDPFIALLALGLGPLLVSTSLSPHISQVQILFHISFILTFLSLKLV